jgi:hypothetical protein
MTFLEELFGILPLPKPFAKRAIGSLALGEGLLMVVQPVLQYLLSVEVPLL